MDALLPQVDGLLGTGMLDPFSGQLCSGGALQASSTINCPKSMVGRVIGKGGETIKALQQFTGAMIQIDQGQDPTRVTVAGDAHSVKMASSMCRDIISGNFKGFAMLRQMTMTHPDKLLPGWETQHKPQPVYVEGYGFVPPSQYIDMEDPKAALAKTLNQTALTQDSALAAMEGIPPVLTQGGQNGYGLPGNTALENELAYNNALANGVNSNALGGLPLFGQGKAASTSAATGLAARRLLAAGGWPTHEQSPAGTSPSSASTFTGQCLGSPHSSLAQGIAYGHSLPNISRSAIPTFGTQLGNSLSACEVNGLLNGTATQGQLDMFASRAAHSAGIASIPESQALLQDLNAAAAAARLGLDSSLGIHSASNASYHGGQNLDCGPRSVSMGALGSSAALRAAAVTSLGLSNSLAASQGRPALPPGLPASQAASQPGTARPASSTPAPGDHPLQTQPLAKESPASSLSSAGSLFSQKAPTLPPGWLQLKDPEGRAFYMHAATQQTTWTFPTTA